MANTESKIVDGTVTAALPNTMFRIELGDGRLVLGTLMGKLRKGFVRIFPGDRVRIEMSPYGEDKGRIVYKL